MRREASASKIGSCGRLRIGLFGLAAWCATGQAAAAQAPRAPAEKFTPLDLHLPPGTILPVKLSHGLSTKHDRPGQGVSARVMQTVLLPDGQTIPAGSRVLGIIVATTPGTSGPAELTLRFDQLEIRHRRMPITTSLRAIASLSEVQEAEVPEVSIGFGTSDNWATTHQIGGDIKYGVDGPVTDSATREVGKGVYNGVLVHVRASEDGKCRGAMDDEDRLQALWLFSADACGVYGIADVEIAHAGRQEPLGTIMLKARQGDVKLRGGTGMLLRVIAARGGNAP